MPLFSWLLDTTVINANIIAHELHSTHRVYKKDLRWKWHEDLASELVNKGNYELNPEHAWCWETNPHDSPNGSSCPGSIPTGNSHQNCRKGYISKYYQVSQGANPGRKFLSPAQTWPKLWWAQPESDPTQNNLGHPKQPKLFLCRD